jgi:hypothetical protein
MSKISDITRAILLGGLPQALDLGTQGRAAQGDNRPEQTAPTGTAVDRDGAVAAQPVAVIQWKQVAIIGVGAVVVGGILFVAFRAAGRRG